MVTLRPVYSYSPKRMNILLVVLLTGTFLGCKVIGLSFNWSSFLSAMAVSAVGAAIIVARHHRERGHEEQ